MNFSVPDFQDSELAARVQHRLDQKTKPQGSLGRIEAVALQLALVQGRENPRLDAPQMVIFAGDHGIAAQGVSAFPQEVTVQMVHNMLAGGAAISVLARQHGLALTVLDCGVKEDFAPAPGIVASKCCHGSADSTQTQALTDAQCEAAIANGAAFVRDLPGNVLMLGEMGIANTSPAALLMARLTGLAIEQCAGRGTGLDPAGVAHKAAVLQRALDRHPDAKTPMAALAALGGPEIATMVGAVLQAAALRRVIVVDGFITTSAVAVAAAIEPRILGACVFSHGSAENGHGRWLQLLGARPLVDLGLRLGEGSGAALAWPLIKSAELILAEMASFESAQVSSAA